MLFRAAMGSQVEFPPNNEEGRGATAGPFSPSRLSIRKHSHGLSLDIEPGMQEEFMVGPVPLVIPADIFSFPWG
jgi:hypothetical protein